MPTETRLGEDEVDGLTDDYSGVVLDDFAVNEGAPEAALCVSGDLADDHAVLQQALFHAHQVFAINRGNQCGRLTLRHRDCDGATLSQLLCCNRYLN